MKKLILITLLIASLFSFGQESFRMKYSCIKIFTPTGGQKSTGANKGIWSDEKSANVTVDFSFGKNKDIIIRSNGVKSIYINDGKPFVGQTPSGIKYQVINTKKGGKTFIFQYLENYNLRLMTIGNNKMIEYGCGKAYDEKSGVNDNIYSVTTNRAYFYSLPNKNSQKKGYLIYGEVINSKFEKSNFIYVEYINIQGNRTNGWILKNNLFKM